jgi:hypothetical protein
LRRTSHGLVAVAAHVNVNDHVNAVVDVVVGR